MVTLFFLFWILPMVASVFFPFVVCFAGRQGQKTHDPWKRHAFVIDDVEAKVAIPFFVPARRLRPLMKNQSLVESHRLDDLSDTTPFLHLLPTSCYLSNVVSEKWNVLDSFEVDVTKIVFWKPIGGI